MIHLLAVLGLGALCGGWVAVQRWVTARDPGAPGVERCHSCGGGCSPGERHHPPSPRS
jgi:hypothetical protein